MTSSEERQARDIAARQRLYEMQYSRDYDWVSSIVPSIDSKKSNLIPRIKDARSEIEQKISQRQTELADLEPQIQTAEKQLADAQNIPVPSFNDPKYFRAYGKHGKPIRDISQYDADRRTRDTAIENAEYVNAILKNKKTNYAQDITDAQTLQNLLNDYEKQTKYAFLNDYERRTTQTAADAGAPFAPALTPSGELRYKQRQKENPSLAVFDVYQQPFEKKPMMNNPVKYAQKPSIADRIFQIPDDVAMNGSNNMIRGNEMKIKDVTMQIQDKYMNKNMNTKREKFNAKRFFG